MIVLTGSLKRRGTEAKTALATETTSRIVASRDRRDHHFAHDPSSPLTPAQRTRFDGPRYGPKQPDFAFVFPSDRGAPTAGALVHLRTVDGQPEPFLSAGWIRFPVADRAVALTICMDVERGQFFLPSRDGTSKRERYGGGRYLDPREWPDGTLPVDSHSASNPYCAHGDGWS